MKKILTLIGLILWGGMGGALSEDAGQWKCPAQYSPQLTINGQPFILATEPFVLQKSTFAFGDPKAGQPFLCFYGATEDSDMILSFFKILTNVKCTFGSSEICNDLNCHCLGEACSLTCASTQN